MTIWLYLVFSQQLVNIVTHGDVYCLTLDVSRTDFLRVIRIAFHIQAFWRHLIQEFTIQCA